MSALTYTALREVISGHFATASYDMDLPDKVLNQSFSNDYTRHISIGGNAETIFRDETEIWNVTFGSFERTGGEGTVEQMREFVASVQTGEIFQFDPYGTIALPDNVIDCYLENKRYSLRRLGNTELFTLSLMFIRV